MTVDRRAFGVGATSLIASALLNSRPAAADNAWEHIAEAGKREGKLGVITPSTSPAFKAVVDSFEKDSGIETSLLVARPAEVRERIRVAKVAGRPMGDVMYTSYAQVKLFDAEDETIDKLPAVPSIGTVRPDLRNDAEMVPMTIIPCGILVNTDLVKPEDEPRSWKDLADPKWKGRILLDEPFASGSGYLWFYMMYDTYGIEFCRQMARQDMVMSRETRVSHRRVAAGEYPIYILFVLTDILPLKGLPVKAYIPTEGSPYVPYGACVLKSAPHPNAARLFLEYSLSDKAQLILANQGFGIAKQSVLDKVQPELRWITDAKLMGMVDPWRERQMVAIAREVFDRK